MTNPCDITVVIPTRNRPDSLNRTLLSIAKQTWLPKQLIIVDSSDIPFQKNNIEDSVSKDNISIFHSDPSVCLQKNIGIEQSQSKYIFLCDDDIVIAENYLEILVTYLEENPSIAIVSGLVYELKNSEWKYDEKKKSFLKLFFAHVFGLSVWTEIKKEDFSKNKMVQQFIAYYLKKGNRIAKSGWPIVIDYSKPCFKTPVYSLEASIIRSESIKNALFDKHFYTHGIGDNYDLTISLNKEVSIIEQAKAFHYREKTNRIEYSKGYFLRVAALHYIMLKHDRFTSKNLFFLIWSLLGNSILFLTKGRIKMVFYNVKLILGIILKRNIYTLKN